MTDPRLVAILGAGSVFLFTLALWFPLYAARRTERRRLRAFVSGSVQSGNVADERPATGPAAPVARWLQARLDRAGVDLSASELALAMVVFASGVTAALFALLAQPDPAVVVIGSAVGALIPLGWLAQRQAAVQRAFRRQLPDAIGLLASALQAGTGIERAFDRLARDTREPMRTAVAGVARQLRVGVPLDRALERLAHRYPSDDVELLRAAIGVHAAIGGQLPRMLHALVGTMRERERIEADINVLTSQQRYSAWVLAALPLIVAVALSFISPDYVSSMFTTAFGRVALLVAAVLVAAGFLTMRRMGRVDV